MMFYCNECGAEVMVSKADIGIMVRKHIQHWVCDECTYSMFGANSVDIALMMSGAVRASV